MEERIKVIPYITVAEADESFSVDLDCIVLDGSELVMASAIDTSESIKHLFNSLTTSQDAFFNLQSKKDYHYSTAVMNSSSFKYQLTKHSEDLTHGAIILEDKDSYIFDWEGKGLAYSLTTFLKERFFLPITEQLCEQMLEENHTAVTYAIHECSVLTSDDELDLQVWKVNCDADVVESWINGLQIDMNSEYEWDNINDISEYLVEFTEPIKDKLDSKINVLYKEGQESQYTFNGLQPYEGQRSIIQGGIETLQQKNSHFLYLAAEPGSGKTLMGTKINHSYHCEKDQRNYCALVVAPATTLNQWKEEIIKSIGEDINVIVISDTSEFIRFYNKTHMRVSKPTYILIGKETFKLSYNRQHAVNTKVKLTGSDKGKKVCTCPDCGSVLVDPSRTSEKVYFTEGDFETPKKNNYKCSECDSVLFQAVYSRNKKTSIIDFVKRKNVRFDSVIIDEFHEANNGSSIIGIASRDIMRRAKKTILLSGTVTNGYASSIHNALLGLIPNTLQKKGVFHKDDFVRQYGTLMAKTKKENYKRQLRASDSAFREIEGVNPKVFTEFMVSNFITAELDDIRDDIPQPVEQYVEVTPLPEVQNNESKLVSDVAKFSAYNGSFYNDSIIKHYANNPFTWGEIPFETKKDNKSKTEYVYPKNIVETLLPKEEKLIEILQKEQSENRKSWVYCDFVTGGKYTSGEALIDRLKRVLEESGLKVFVLKSDVRTMNRMKEIEKAKDSHDVFLSHPKLVSVGVNLQWCTNYIFYTPSYHVNTVRQAKLRGRRANSTEQNRITHLYYNEGVEETIMNRYKLKLAESQAIEGKFANIDLDTDRTASSLGAKIERELSVKR